MSDSRAAVLHLEAHHAGTSAVHLDHEAAVRRGIRLGSFDLSCNRIPVVRSPSGEKGVHIVVIHELDEEVDIVETRPSDGDHHGRKRSRGPSSAPGRLLLLTQVAPEQPLHRALGLTDEELDRIRELLERDPNDFELAVFSLLWSEHCGYKHSALLLRRLPSEGERVLQGPGENAGVIDLGEGEAVAFKVESHNHPSAVEPFQGAATGVGGILRDIVAMGARPIALLDGLRFAEPDHHFSRAVAGIGHYGNSVGVATVGGEAVYDEAYRDNCLVNAMCIGLLPADRVTRARATAIGAHVVLYGATTGRDGIGGASVLASAELGEDDPDKRPTVQMGDPFTGKKLIEASLELVEGGLVESLQDCGAAGLASSLAEMARDGAGIDVHLDRVPLRETGMEPWEIMISESQERMVAVVRPQMLEAVQRVCATWELPCTPIGDVSDTGDLRAFFDNELVGCDPAALCSPTSARATRWRPDLTLSSTSSLPSTTACRRHGCTSSTTNSSARAPFGAPGSTLRCCGYARLCAALRSLSRVPRRASAIHSARACWRCWALRVTSRAPGASRSRSPTASTSAIPRNRRSGGSSSRPSTASLRQPMLSASPSSRATSRCTTTPMDGRSHPRRWSAASGSSPTFASFREHGEAATSSSSPPHPVTSISPPRRHSSASSGRLLLC